MGSGKFSTTAPDRNQVPGLPSFNLQLHADTMAYVNDPDALAQSLGGNGFKDIFASRTVFIGAFAACMGGLLFGFDQGILAISLTMPQFLSQFPEMNEAVSSSAASNKGIMTGLLEVGAFLGALMAGYVADKYSRKNSIVFGSVWFIVGSVLQASAYSFSQLVVGRFLGGVGIGILSSTAPMYISEIAPPNIRGALLVLESANIVIGVIIMFYITYGTRHIPGDWSFRLPFTLQMAPCAVLAAVLWSLPYSPRWLAGKGRDKEALESLKRLRCLSETDPRLQAEWIAVRAEAIRNRELIVTAHPTIANSEFKLEVAGWIDMFRPRMFRRTQIGIMLMFFQQFVGINALVYYAPTLFATLGLDYELQINLSGAFNIVNWGAIMLAFFLLDKVGRRPFLLWGAIGMAASHFIVAAMIGVYGKNWDAHPAQAWVGVVCIFGFSVSYGIGWGPVPWTMPAEILTSSTRAKGVALATCSNWLFNAVIGLMTPPMIQNTGYGTFIFFGASASLAFIYTWFFVPETKGRTLENMDEVFGSKIGFEDAMAKKDIISLIVGRIEQHDGKGGELEEVERV